MKVNHVNVLGVTHVQKVEPHPLLLVHYQARQIVDHPINGWKERERAVVINQKLVCTRRSRVSHPLPTLLPHYWAFLGLPRCRKSPWQFHRTNARLNEDFWIFRLLHKHLQKCGLALFWNGFSLSPPDFVPLLLKALPICLSHWLYKCPLDAERWKGADNASP